MLNNITWFGPVPTRESEKEVGGHGRRVVEGSPRYAWTSSVPADLTLCFADGDLDVHSQILSLASPVFAAMLSSEMIEGKTKQITIHERKRRDFLSHFYEFLHPLLCRMKEITGANVEIVLEIAHYYQVRWLVDECIAAYVALPYHQEVHTVARACRFRDLGITELYDHFVEMIATTLWQVEPSDFRGDSAVARDLISRAQQIIAENRRVESAIFCQESPRQETWVDDAQPREYSLVDVPHDVHSQFSRILHISEVIVTQKKSHIFDADIMTYISNDF